MFRPLVASMLALSAFSAAAVPEYAGHLGLNPGAYSAPHAFNDADHELLDHAFVFVLDRRHDAVGRAGVVAGLASFEAAGAMLSLWRSNGDMDFGNDELLGGFDFGSTVVEQRFDGLDRGEYFWRLEALVTGAYGEILFEADHTAAVPEPGSAALLAAGLLAVGFVARRRQGR
jgi:PEP-CTERM motif